MSRRGYLRRSQRYENFHVLQLPPRFFLHAAGVYGYCRLHKTYLSKAAEKRVSICPLYPKCKNHNFYLYRNNAQPHRTTQHTTALPHHPAPPHSHTAPPNCTAPPRHHLHCRPTAQPHRNGAPRQNKSPCRRFGRDITSIAIIDRESRPVIVPDGGEPWPGRWDRNPRYLRHPSTRP